MSRYVRWRREGYLSSTGRCFDIGITVSGALQRFEQSGDPFAVESLEAALWAFHHSDDFRSGALLAVNLGDDADTTGAVYGQLAGACYGAGGIPTEWRARLAMSETIATLADRLYQLAGWVRSTGAH